MSPIFNLTVAEPERFGFNSPFTSVPHTSPFTMDDKKIKLSAADTGKSAEHSKVSPTAPYTRGSPCPPPVGYIDISTFNADNQPSVIRLDHSLRDIDPSLVSAEELKILRAITPHHEAQVDPFWQYESRRTSQRITEYLHVGPHTMLRDIETLKQKGITMVIAIRDARIVKFQQKNDEAIQQMGIQLMNVGINSTTQLISEFHPISRAIVEHLMSVHKQNMGDTTRHGKILLTCDTGNDRAPAAAAAFLIAVVGCGALYACQYVSVQRFCCTFDETIRRMLANWESVVRARATVARDSANSTIDRPKVKRGFEEAMDMDSDPVSGSSEMDADRFGGRTTFVPFKDVEDSHA